MVSFPGDCFIVLPDAVCIGEDSEGPAVKEAADISGGPGRMDREARTKHDGRDSDRTADTGPDANQAPEKERPALQGRPLSQGGTRASGPEHGRTQNEDGRGDDAEGSGRPAAEDGATKRGRQMMARLVRMHGGLRQGG